MHCATNAGCYIPCSSYKENGSIFAVVKETLHLQLRVICYHDFRLCGWVVWEELFGGVQ